MRKIWVISSMVLVFLAMAACGGMYQGGERVFRARGTVTAYEPGKMIKLAEGLEVTRGTTTEINYYTAAPTYSPQYVITPATEVIGEVKPGIRVLIRYKMSGLERESPKTALSIEAIWGK